MSIYCELQYVLGKNQEIHVPNASETFEGTEDVFQKPLIEGEIIQKKRTNNNLIYNHIGNRNSMLINQAIDVYFELI